MDPDPNAPLEPVCFFVLLPCHIFMDFIIFPMALGMEIYYLIEDDPKRPSPEELLRRHQALRHKRSQLPLRAH